jgi:hypothetical protein
MAPFAPAQDDDAGEEESKDDDAGEEESKDDDAGEEESKEGEESEEAGEAVAGSPLELVQEAWMRCAGILASRIVHHTTSDEALLKQHHQELFELMVSMGVVEFVTEGYKFQLSPVISVTPIVP